MACRVGYLMPTHTEELLLRNWCLSTHPHPPCIHLHPHPKCASTVSILHAHASAWNKKKHPYCWCHLPIFCRSQCHYMTIFRSLLRMSMKPFCNIRYLYDFLYYIIIVTWMLQFSYHQKRMILWFLWRLLCVFSKFQLSALQSFQKDWTSRAQ